MRFKRIGVVTLLIGSSLLTGCATIMNGGPDKVTFKSEPTGATVSIDDKPMGKTPVTVEVPRLTKYVTFSYPGYDETKVAVERTVNGWVFGNIIFGGLIGIIVDFSSGNNMVAVEQMQVTLRRGGNASLPDLSPGLAWLHSKDNKTVNGPKTIAAQIAH